MAVHIFVVSEENYEICIRRGSVGLPEPKETTSHDNIFDGLISRIACVKENDYILMYVIGTKELRGVWKAEGLPFYDIEVKRNKFDKEALKQLIDYESWFLMKKVSGDLNMVRTSAIAESFADDVIRFVQERKEIENKTVKLITYRLNDKGEFILDCIHR